MGGQTDRPLSYSTSSPSGPLPKRDEEEKKKDDVAKEKEEEEEKAKNANNHCYNDRLCPIAPTSLCRFEIV